MKKLTPCVELPPNPRVGVCYAQLYFPPEYTPQNESVVVKPPYREYVSSTAELRENTVRVETAGQGLRVVRVQPARYEMRQERIKIQDAYHRIVTKPATFRKYQVAIPSGQPRKVWKRLTSEIYGMALRRSNGEIIRRVDPHTGTVLCLVEEHPAPIVVDKWELVSPASQQRVKGPAQYITITKRVMVEPPKLITETVEAQYKRIRVRELVRDAEVREKTFPAQSAKITINNLTHPGEVKWGEVFCKENFPVAKVKELQRALGPYYTSRGGTIDGIYLHVARI